MVEVPSNAKTQRVEHSAFETLRASLKDEVTSELEKFLVESLKELLKKAGT